jgi:hypothetical protein
VRPDFSRSSGWTAVSFVGNPCDRLSLPACPLLTSPARTQLGLFLGRRELTRLCPVRPGCPPLPWAMRVRCRSQSPDNGAPLSQAGPARARRDCARDSMGWVESIRSLIRHAASRRRYLREIVLPEPAPDVEARARGGRAERDAARCLALTPASLHE